MHQGERVTFVNTTTDSHTMTLVVSADVPRKIADVFTCPLCDAVNNVYFPLVPNSPRACRSITVT